MAEKNNILSPLEARKKLGNKEFMIQTKIRGEV